MSDDPIEAGFDAYAHHLRRTATMPPAAEIRRRADRRRRNRAAGATFAAVLIAVVGIGATLDRRPHRTPTPAGPSPSAPAGPSSAAPATTPSRTKPASTTKSNVSQLRGIGVTLDRGVLIDVADDGVDLWMQVGAGDVVDFTGAAKDDSTEMSLRAAPVTGANRVLIVPVSRPGSCVADTPREPLALRPCEDGDTSQVWQVVPAGDSGQFELKGRYGILTVDQKLVNADQSGRTGLQTIKF